MNKPLAWLRSSGTGTPVITDEMRRRYPEYSNEFETPLYAAVSATPQVALYECAECSQPDCQWSGSCDGESCPRCGGHVVPAEHFVREDVDSVLNCLGDDAAQLREQNEEDERAANMDRAASMLTWMLLTHPYYRTNAASAGTWRPMNTAPTDGTMVRLLIDYTAEDACHALEDALQAVTIGANTDGNTGQGEGWKFAGWSWEQDCFTQGIGRPMGWQPFDSNHTPESAEAEGQQP